VPSLPRRTYDGQKAVVPNSQIYSEALLVKTAYQKRRSQYGIGIGCANDIGEACEIILDILQQVDDIESEPAPQAFAWNLAPAG
jgi:small-conductance mechanosensitive channel